MPSSPIIDLALGLAFVFGVTAALSSALTELIARFLGLRGAYLLSGLRELLDSGTATTDLKNAVADYDSMKNMASGTTRGRPTSATGALLGGPILSSQGMAGQITDRSLMLRPPRRPDRPARLMAAPAGKKVTIPPDGDGATQPDGPDASRAAEDTRRRRPGLLSQRRSLPSYISATSFAEAVIDMLVPTGTGPATMDGIEASLGRLPGDLPFRKSLQALVNNADGDVSRFRAATEGWYDEHMARVSGWYKRRVAKITLVVGAILVLMLNINTLTIGRTLYGDSTVNTAVSSVAAKVTNCKNQSDPSSCLADLQAEVSAATTAGLPIGWGTVRDCTAPHARCNWLDQRGIFSRHGGSGWQLLLVIVGFLVTIIALVPGARFWFDLLSKLGSLRASGPKPATSTA